MNSLTIFAIFAAIIAQIFAYPPVVSILNIMYCILGNFRLNSTAQSRVILELRLILKQFDPFTFLFDYFSTNIFS